MFHELVMSLAMYTSTNSTIQVYHPTAQRSSGGGFHSSSGGSRSSSSSSSSGGFRSSNSGGFKSAPVVPANPSRSVYGTQSGTRGGFNSNSNSRPVTSYNSHYRPTTTINRSYVSHTYYHAPYVYHGYSGGYGSGFSSGFMGGFFTMMVLNSMTHQYQPQVVVVQPGQTVPQNAQPMQGPPPQQMPANAYSLDANGNLVPYNGQGAAPSVPMATPTPQPQGNPIVGFFQGIWSFIGWIIFIIIVLAVVGFGVLMLMNILRRP